jgi:predicted N-acetyltransferase YhbS
VTNFHCGSEVLDDWLHDHASVVQASRTGRTFVWHDDGTVVGYYTLAAHRVARDILPARLGRGSPDQVPAVLLARLALDESLQRCGLGGRLLGEACYRAAVTSLTVGARMIIVDALDEAAAKFYERHGFSRVPDALRLARKMSDAVKAFANL